jgi:hypothetical protein
MEWIDDLLAVAEAEAKEHEKRAERDSDELEDLFG